MRYPLPVPFQKYQGFGSIPEISLKSTNVHCNLHVIRLDGLKDI